MPTPVTVHPCPSCGGRDAEKVTFSWWGGMLGPRMIKQVRCRQCRSTFRGDSGKPDTGFIVGYVIVTGVIALGVIVLFFFARS
jgi:rubredoxin